MFADVILLGENRYRTKFNIIGFPKCGQVSMQDYLLKRYSGYNIRRDELIWRKSGVEDYENLWSNLRPIIMIRDPVKACWSNYWYMGSGDPKNDLFKSYEEFLVTPYYKDPIGEGNPISCYNFNKWIKRFLKFKPIIVELESIRENPNFPTLNTTVATRSFVKDKFGTMPEMPDHYVELTKKLLKKEVEEHPDPSWSVDYL